MTSIKIDEFGSFSFWLIEDKILAIRLLENDEKALLDVPTARYALAVQRNLCKKNKEKILVLANLSNMSRISAEARAWAKSPEGLEVNTYISAYALVAPNLFGRMLASIIMRIYKPSYAAKLFPNEKMAIDWLLTYKNS